MEKAFDDWLYRHPCSVNELWKIQNMLGTILGFQHPLAEAAQAAWRQAAYDTGKV